MIEWVLVALLATYIARWGMRRLARAQTEVLREESVQLLMAYQKV